MGIQRRTSVFFSNWQALKTFLLRDSETVVFCFVILNPFFYQVLTSCTCPHLVEVFSQRQICENPYRSWCCKVARKYRKVKVRKVNLKEKNLEEVRKDHRTVFGKRFTVSCKIREWKYKELIPHDAGQTFQLYSCVVFSRVLLLLKTEKLLETSFGKQHGFNVSIYVCL